MVVEDEWGDIVAYASAAGNSVAQTARNSSYLAQIREKYPKVSIVSFLVFKLVVILFTCEEN